MQKQNFIKNWIKKEWPSTFGLVITIIFMLTFLFSYPWELGGHYYDIITGTSVLGMILTLGLRMGGILMFPVVLIFQSIIRPSLDFLGSISFTTLYSLLVGIVLIGLVLFKKEKINKDGNLNLVIILGFIALFSSIINGQTIGFSNWGLVHYFEAILIFCVISFLVNTKERFRLMSWILLLGIVSLAFYLTQHSFSYNTSILGFENNGLARIFSFYFLFFIGFFWAEKKILLKFLIIVSIAFLAKSITQLGSRATMIAVGVAGLLLCLKNLRKKSLWAMGGLGIVFLMLFTPQLFFNDFGSIFTETPKGVEADDGSISGRFLLLQHGLYLFKKRPILGYGVEYQMFSQLALENFGWEKAAHNSYVDVAIEMGLFGLLSYVLLFAFSIYYTYKAQKLSQHKDDYIYNLSQGTMFGLIAIGINNFMLSSPWIPTIFIGFGLSSALYYMARNLHTEETVFEVKKEATSLRSRAAQALYYLAGKLNEDEKEKQSKIKDFIRKNIPSSLHLRSERFLREKKRKCSEFLFKKKEDLLKKIPKINKKNVREVQAKQIKANLKNGEKKLGKLKEKINKSERASKSNLKS